jgi:hypothetical protein
MAKAKKQAKPIFDVDTWLEEYIYQQVEGEDYVDNFRWAVLGDLRQMEVYNAARANGCCGSFDGQVTAPDGLTYVVGCNYGH